MSRIAQYFSKRNAVNLLVSLGILLVASLLALWLPGLTSLWGFLAFSGWAAFLKWRKIQLVREDFSQGVTFGTSSPDAWKTALILIGIALLFQLARWLAVSGELRSRTGDDDEGYVFLSYQILGYFGSPPMFALRAPGWPLIISGLLRLFGERSLWSVGIYHRLLLASFAPLYYLILDRYLRRPAAITVALLSMAMEYNELIAEAALGDLTYTGLGLLSLFGLLETLTQSRPYPWLAASGLVTAIRTLIRITALPVALAEAVALWLTSRGNALNRLKIGSFYILPSLLAVLGLSFYNQTVSNHFAPSMGGGLTFFTQYGAYLGTTPDTPAVHQLAVLLPEVPPEHLFFNSGDMWVAQYRFTASGKGDAFDYGALANQAMKEVALARPWPVARRAAQGVIVMLANPLRELLPSDWIHYPTTSPYEAQFEGALPACNVQYGFGAAVEDSWCEQYTTLRSSIEFRPPWLSIPQPVQQAFHLLTISFPYRVRGIIWPFYMGLAAFASLVYLMKQSGTWRLALLLALPLIAEFALVVSVTNGIETRYLFYFHPSYLLLTSLAFSYVLRQPEVRITSG